VVETSFSSLFGSFLTVRSNPVSFESSESSVAGLLFRPEKEFCGVILVKDGSLLCGGDTGGVRSDGWRNRWDSLFVWGSCSPWYLGKW